MKQFMYFFALFIAVVMTACSSKDDFAQDTTPKPIVIKASINGMDTKTRAINDATQLQNADFIDGAKINVYLKKNTSKTNIDGVAPDPGYIIYEKNDGIWSPTAETAPSETLYWPQDDDLLLQGFYPSKDISGRPITINTTEFSVAKIQNEYDEYRSSDFMYAEDMITRIENPELKFKHKLTKITAVVDANGLYDNNSLNTLVCCVYIYAKQTAQFDSNFNVTGVKGNTTDICAYDKLHDDYYYSTNGMSCIIPPQDLTPGDNFIEIGISQNNTFLSYFYSVPAEGLSLKAGKEYKFTLKLNSRELVLDNPVVEDWTTENKTGNAQ